MAGSVTHAWWRAARGIRRDGTLRAAAPWAPAQPRNLPLPACLRTPPPCALAANEMHSYRAVWTSVKRRSQLGHLWLPNLDASRSVHTQETASQGVQLNLQWHAHRWVLEMRSERGSGPRRRNARYTRVWGAAKSRRVARRAGKCCFSYTTSAPVITSGARLPGRSGDTSSPQTCSTTCSCDELLLIACMIVNESHR